MKTNSLKKLCLFAVAATMLPGLALAQTSVTTDPAAGQPAEMTIASPDAPVAPISPAQPAVGSPMTQGESSAVPTTLSPIVSGSSSDPAVSAVLDRLKQDTTPLSISDMSAAQDALARLNLLNEIEQKLSQIEETRQKRQFGAFAPMGAMPLPGTNMTGAMDMASMQGMNNMANFGATKNSDEPEIVSITGAGGTYTALIKVGSRNVSAKSGTTLPDGSKVTRINADGVSISKKGKTSKLSFAQAE